MNLYSILSLFDKEKYTKSQEFIGVFYCDPYRKMKKLRKLLIRTDHHYS